MKRGNNSNSTQHRKIKNAGDFFLATLIIWSISVMYEIFYHDRKQLVPIVFGCLFFQFANWVLRFMVSKQPLFVNTCVSLLHSSLASASVVIVLLNQWTSKRSIHIFDHEQLVYDTWAWAYQALCFSCGYYAYNQLDMLKYHIYIYSGWFPSILAHHLLLLVCFTLALYRNVTINYLILILICELHSVFVHVRKIRQMAGIRDAKTLIVKLEWILNWVTFIFARLVPHMLILIKLVKDASKFSKGIQLPLALLGMISMNLLNIGLGIDLLGAFKREINRPMDRHRD